MNESLLQFIWRFQYFNRTGLFTITGDPVEVLFQGSLNANQGPDFFNAKIKIGGIIWIGTIELHLRTSDWLKHGHEQDANYNNVVLHVVYENDAVPNTIPVVELKSIIATGLLKRYNQLMLSRQFIPCEKLTADVPDLIISTWKHRLLAERLYRKTFIIENYLEQSNRHWEECFWWLLAKNFGARTNTESFEAVAQSIPLNVLAKHKNQLIQLEALLLGQAGLLRDGNTADKYVLLLQKEYGFLKQKYHLRAIPYPVHFLRMRPANFPTVRLAQLAALIFSSAHLFSKIIDEPDIQKVKRWFGVAPNDYWQYHYTLNDEASLKVKSVGSDMMNNILINTVVPMLYAYGNAYQRDALKSKALNWLEEIGAERNAIVNGFAIRGFESKTAYDSQAFIELKTQYCDQKKCLSCAIGNTIIKNG